MWPKKREATISYGYTPLDKGDRHEAIGFEHRNDLFTVTADGHKIDPEELDALLSVVSVSCPACNNARFAEIDRDILSGRSWNYIVNKYMMTAVIRRDGQDYFVDAKVLTAADLTRHAALHLFPIFHGTVEALHTLCQERFGLKEFRDLDKNGVYASTVEARVERMRDLVAQFSDMATDHQKMVRIEARAKDDTARISKAKDELKRLAEDGKVNFLACDDPDLKSGCSDYMIGYDGIGKYRPWGYARMNKELSKRAENTVNFLDEMMNIRKMSYRIYNEIMDEGDPKLYGTAISAVREIRGVMETLGKMSLIAKKLGDDNAGVKRLSEPMQDMIRKMGVLSDTEFTDQAVPPTAEETRSLSGQDDEDAPGGVEEEYMAADDRYIGPREPMRRLNSLHEDMELLKDRDADYAEATIV